MASLNVFVPDAMGEWVQGRVDGGSYADASDYVRALIRRDWEDARQNEVLAAALAEGERSGFSPRKVEDIWDAVEREFDAKGG